MENAPTVGVKGDEPSHVGIRVAHELEASERTTDVLLPETSTITTANNTIPSFADMGLSLEVLKGLQAAGFQRPSPVQVKAIPLGKLGVDLIVQAKSGTGKTVVFAILALETVNVKQKAVQAIVISPTREIALQSTTVIREIGQFIPGLRVALFVGGISMSQDIKNLEHCHIAVGTPGRLKFLIQGGHLDCSSVRLLVFDEADLLFSGGLDLNSTSSPLSDDALLTGKNTFPAAINFIWWAIPADRGRSRQVVALSATYTEHLVHRHLPRYLRSPALVRLSAEDPALLGVRQFFLRVPTTRGVGPAAVFRAKVKELVRLLKEVDFKQCLVFSNYHNSAEQLCESLRMSGWPVAYISSGLDQNERFKAFNSLRAFQCRILVSTDLTARGIDAENVNLVINLEVPWSRDTYLHRIGRAGRFGSYGASILLVADTEEEIKSLSRIEVPNSAPICQLPDPIPVDLATAECPLDISKLVTVTTLTTDNAAARGASPHQPPSRKPKPCRKQVVIPEEVSPPVRPKAVTSSTVIDRTLADNLKAYTEAVLTRPAVRVGLSTEDPVNEESYPPPSSSPRELETKILRQLSDLLEGKADTTSQTQVSIDEEEEEETEDEREEVAEQQCHHQSVVCCHTNQQVAEETRVLTPRQTILWNEYCRLVGWKDYYYAAWWNTCQEYEATLAEYQRLAAENPAHLAP